MSKWESQPSFRRTMFASSLIIVFLALGLALKLARDFGVASFLLPLDVGGTSPNFILPFVLPLFLCIPRNSIGLWQFSKNTSAFTLGLIVYECIQLAMPWRTFDFYDILASIVGGLSSLLLAWLLFFRRRTSREE